MKNTLGVWKALDFQFDAISTGFIVSKEQTQMITDFCSENADKFKGIPLEPVWRYWTNEQTQNSDYIN